jgi:hypothetical protein
MTGGRMMSRASSSSGDQPPPPDMGELEKVCRQT